MEQVATEKEARFHNVADNYELNGESLIPFLTTSKPEHRKWIYTFHNEKQLIRSKDVLIDGQGTIYDVAKYPADLISFPKIKEVSETSKTYQTEYKELKDILPRFDMYKTEHDAPVNGIGKVDPLKVKK